MRINPVLQGLFKKLVDAGKPRMQAVGACMRKLVMLCYWVAKNRKPFNPEWASKRPVDNALSGSACYEIPTERNRTAR